MLQQGIYPTAFFIEVGLLCFILRIAILGPTTIKRIVVSQNDDILAKT